MAGWGLVATAVAWDIWAAKTGRRTMTRAVREASPPVQAALAGLWLWLGPHLFQPRTKMRRLRDRD